jgi:hypothetical protein
MQSAISLTLVAALVATEPAAVAAGESGQVGREDVVSQSTPATEQCKKASSIASSFEMLQAIVRTGDTLLVRDANGRKIKGTLRGLSGGSLDLLEWNNGQRRRFPEVDVREIEIECPDPLWNGALIGAVSAMVVLLPGFWASGSGEKPGVVVASFAAYGAFGAAVGAFIDSKKRDTITIYSAPAQRASRLQIAPLLSKSRAGVQIAVRF